MRMSACDLMSHWKQSLWIVVLGLLLNGAPISAQTRAPIPSAEKQKEFSKLLEDGYDLPRLESVAKRHEALAKLMESLADENLGADERYVVLTTAISLASQTGNAGEWLKAVNTLVETFDVDVTKEKTRLLTEYLKASKPNAQVKPIVEEAIAMSQAAAKEHQFSEALAVLSSVDVVLRRAADGPALKPLMVEARTAISAREKEWKAYQAATTKLQTNADDAAANLSVGRWYVIQDSDWKKALPFLAKGNDVKWKGAAELERGGPTDATGQVAVADAWWDIAQKESGPTKTALLVHAGQWYEQAEPDLTSALKKQVVAKRLDEIVSLSPVTTGTRLVTPPPKSPAKSDEWIDILPWSEGVDWAHRGINWNQFLVGNATSKGITLKSAICARFPLSAIVDGSYELEVDFTRHEGDECVGIFFPVGIHNMNLQLHAANGAKGGVAIIDGKWLTDNVTTRSPAVVSNNQRHKIRVRVRDENPEAAFAIDFDSFKNFIKWEGKSASLTYLEGGDWKVSTTQRPWLQSQTGHVTFHSARIRMLSGSMRREVTVNDGGQDLKDGFIRLTEQKAIVSKTGHDNLHINQLPLSLGVGDTEYRWPLVIPDFRFCDDYYGAHAPSRLKCPIPSGAKSFSVVGYNEASRTTKSLAFIDGKKVYDSGITNIALVKIEIPAKATLLELVFDDANDGRHDYSYWCYPRYHTVPANKLTDAMLDGKPGPLKFAIASNTVGTHSLTHNQPIETLPMAPLQFHDALPCQEFLFAHAPSTVAYEVPDGMTRFSAIGYCVLSQSVKFEVWANNKLVYESPAAGIVRIDVKLPAGTKTIELKINHLGDLAADHSMWCFPRLHRR
ncbi:MAG: hypothetical protein JWP89_4134 [Schlesneria sp.]|nr:hypothetical protein [Schlesneria sp.]